MKYSEVNKDEHGNALPKIKSFTPELSKKSLIRIGGSWYASDGLPITRLAEEITNQEGFLEGAKKTLTVNSYERDERARTACIAHHGFRCAVCDFLFSEKYGGIGEKFIHVHHIIPVSEIGENYLVDPIKDLIPVCPNCHAMIHTTRPPLTVAQLRSSLDATR